MTIGERIKSERIYKGISQTVLAEICSVTQQAVGKWEKDISQPSIEILNVLANYFNVSIDYLTGRTERMTLNVYQEDIFMEMGEIIKALRLEKGLTQEQLGNLIGVQKSAIRKYESGVVQNMKRSSIQKLAEFFHVSPAFLMGFTTQRNNDLPDNISPVQTQRVPMLGEIACGKPIWANEERESYVQAGVNIKADFCLIARGDSMIGARIHDGDIVFCRSQNMVENGEIAAVIIGDEATLKRVYYYPDK